MLISRVVVFPMVMPVTPMTLLSPLINPGGGGGLGYSPWVGKEVDHYSLSGWGMGVLKGGGINFHPPDVYSEMSKKL